MGVTRSHSVVLALQRHRSSRRCLLLFGRDFTCRYFVFQNERAGNAANGALLNRLSSKSIPEDDEIADDSALQPSDPIATEPTSMKIDSRTSLSSVNTIDAAITLGAQLQSMVSIEDRFGCVPRGLGVGLSFMCLSYVGIPERAILTLSFMLSPSLEMLFHTDCCLLVSTPTYLQAWIDAAELAKEQPVADV